MTGGNWSASKERRFRAIFNDKQCGYEELLLKANLPSLYNRRIQDKVQYKVKFKLLPQRAKHFTLSYQKFRLHSRPIFDCYFWKTLPSLPKTRKKIPSEASNISSLKQFKLFVRKVDLSNIRGDKTFFPDDAGFSYMMSKPSGSKYMQL